MGTQWENFLQNLGEWQGSFTQLSPTGEAIADTPTLLSLEGLDENERVRLTLRFFAADATPGTDPPTREMVRQYQSLGRDILFFDSGAFSQGSIQLSPVSEFGSEFGFVSGDRRLRLVQLFAPGGAPDKFTLIRETRVGSQASPNPPLSLDSLIGTWEGEAQVLYPDWRNPDRFPTTLQLEKIGTDRLEQKTTFGSGDSVRAIASSAKINGNILDFDRGSHPVRVLLLPDGASLTFPLSVTLRQPFFLEAGWAIAPNLRQRLIRSYSDRGEWTSLTLVTERKQ